MKKIAIVLILTICCVSIFAVQTGVAFADTTVDTTETYYIGPNSENLSRTLTNHNIWFNGSSIDQVHYVQTANGGPAYSNSNSALTNCCANVAGSILVGFYDRYYEDLIPDVSTYSTTYNLYLPMSLVKKPVQAVTDEMYTRMGTNTIEPGTNEDQFISGLKSFFNAKGKTFKKTSVSSNGKLNLDAMKKAFSENKPVAILSRVYNTMSINMVRAAATVTVDNVPHIFVAVGYSQYGVYDENGNLVQTFDALKILNGLDATSKVLYLDYNYLTVDNAYKIEIT